MGNRRSSKTLRLDERIKSREMLQPSKDRLIKPATVGWVVRRLLVYVVQTSELLTISLFADALMPLWITSLSLGLWEVELIPKPERSSPSGRLVPKRAMESSSSLAWPLFLLHLLLDLLSSVAALPTILAF
jgi:hypothetical protein